MVLACNTALVSRCHVALYDLKLKVMMLSAQNSKRNSSPGCVDATRNQLQNQIQNTISPSTKRALILQGTLFYLLETSMPSLLSSRSPLLY
jgi:hypothetical protein